eukprot:5429196-Amphidinium_carterae.1
MLGHLPWSARHKRRNQTRIYSMASNMLSIARLSRLAVPGGGNRPSTFNARVETVGQSNMWRRLVDQRCEQCSAS